MINNKMKCKRCDYEWLPRIKNPKACPHCKNYNWCFISDGVCLNCGKYYGILVNHHIKPLEDGGLDIKDNIQKVCFSCHRFLHKKLREKIKMQVKGLE